MDLQSFDLYGSKRELIVAVNDLRGKETFQMYNLNCSLVIMIRAWSHN